MLEASVVTTLPLASCTWTVTAGEIACPAAVVSVSWTLNASLLAAPAAMVKALLVAAANPVLLAARCIAARSRLVEGQIRECGYAIDRTLRQGSAKTPAAWIRSDSDSDRGRACCH